jgi:phosphoinositide-3-kinase regulatory subunit 4
MNDVLLAHTITYLNDRDWLLRAAFFESVVDVAACAGGRSLEEYILPLMVQALSGALRVGPTQSIRRSNIVPDVEETVVAQVLNSLTSLCELGLFQKMRIWELMGATLGFLYHPNIWIRQGGSVPLLRLKLPFSHRAYTGAVAFMTAAAKQLPSTDVWCILYPSLRHFLKSDVHVIDEASLLVALKSHVSLVVSCLC